MLLLSAIPAAAGPAADWAAWYEQSLEWQADATPKALPAEGLRLNRGGAELLLEAGEVRPLVPGPDGIVNGLVFEGSGRLVLPVPDPWEREQFAFRSGAEPAGTIDLAFSAMTLRSSGGLSSLLPESLKCTRLESCREAKESHERWFLHARRDVDARVAAGRLIPGDDYLIAEIDTATFGPLTLEYDPFRREPLRLERYRTTNDHAEVWISQSTTETAEGQPLIDLTHAELAVNLEHHAGREAHDLSQGSKAGDLRQWPWTDFSARLTLVPGTDGLRALPLLLEPRARVDAVFDGAGQPLAFLRDHMGKRAVIIHNMLHDDSLVILLDKPLTAGEPVDIRVDYSIRTSNQVLGRDWYPRPVDRHHDPHTARINVSHPKKIEIRASGRQQERTVEGGDALTVWVADEPTDAVGFSYGKGFKEVVVEREGQPPVASFGTEDGITIGDIRRNVGRDLLDCLAFLADYLGTDSPVERLQATRATGFTQPYRGFINLSVLAYNRESPGLSRLLRGREAAAQFWVGNIDWQSHRDQWLAEGLTDYCTLLAIEASGEHPGYYDQIIRTLNTDMIGSGKGVARRTSARLRLPEYDRIFSSVPIAGYLRDSEWLLLPSQFTKVNWEPKHLKMMGPIGLGSRSSPAEVPYAFSVWNARRGVLVLHMLRQLLDNRPDGSKQDLFRTILGDFYRTHAGGRAGTKDFIAAVQKGSRRDWGWFFDQWVHGRGTPTLTWGWSVTDRPDGQGNYRLTIEVEKSDVPDDFIVMVPVWAEFGDGQYSQVILPLDEASKRFEFPIPRKPEKLVFNPRHEVLAQVLRKE